MRDVFEPEFIVPAELSLLAMSSSINLNQAAVESEKNNEVETEKSFMKEQRPTYVSVLKAVDKQPWYTNRRRVLLNMYISVL